MAQQEKAAKPEALCWIPETNMGESDDKFLKLSSGLTHTLSGLSLTHINKYKQINKFHYETLSVMWGLSDFCVLHGNP